MVAVVYLSPGRKQALKVLAMSVAMTTCDSTLAYTPGTIAAKAEPVTAIIRELADLVAYAAGLWACIRLMLNQKAEAKDMMKSVGYGYSFIQLSPIGMEIIKSIGK